MEVLFFIATVLISVYVEAIVGVTFNFPGIGCIVEVAFVGAVLLYVIRHRK